MTRTIQQRTNAIGRTNDQLLEMNDYLIDDIIQLNAIGLNFN
jgi:hypothetical protein